MLRLLYNKTSRVRPSFSKSFIKLNRTQDACFQILNIDIDASLQNNQQSITYKPFCIREDLWRHIRQRWKRSRFLTTGTGLSRSDRTDPDRLVYRRSASLPVTTGRPRIRTDCLLVPILGQEGNDV